jgi:SAM-dependent methyltransferase
MTKPLRAALEVILETIGIPKRVLEIGSRQAINQEDLADIRSLLPNSKYIGTDAQDGPGVDIAVSAYELPFKNGSFDLVLCFETMEHADKPWQMAEEIQRVLSSKGVAIVSSQQNFPIHMHPSDYFRYTPYGLKSLFRKLKYSFVFAISPPFDDEVKLNPQHVILIGSKSENNKLFLKIKKSLRNNIKKISVHKPYSHRFEEIMRLIRRAISEIHFRQEIEFFK